MSIKQRLEYGIFPIASRRHQPRDNWGSFHQFSHTYTYEESLSIIISWILIIPNTLILAAVSGHALWLCFGIVLFLTGIFWWIMKYD